MEIAITECIVEGFMTGFTAGATFGGLTYLGDLVTVRIEADSDD